MNYTIERLKKGHIKKDFTCGEPALDHYLKKIAGQDVKRSLSVCFAAVTEDQTVAGYYTLSSTAIPIDKMPDSLASKLPRYSDIPAARIGRLAVDTGYQGDGLGGMLIYDALYRASQSDVASFALVVDAKNEFAVEFYKKHGFLLFEDEENVLFLPLSPRYLK